MKAQGTFEALMAVVMILSCLYVTAAVYMRESEVTAVHSLIQNIVQSESARDGQRSALEIFREGQNEWKFFVVLDSPSPSLGTKISEGLAGYGCKTGIGENGIYIVCPYNTYWVVM
jgi:hypothetical protein